MKDGTLDPHEEFPVGKYNVLLADIIDVRKILPCIFDFSRFVVDVRFKYCFSSDGKRCEDHVIKCDVKVFEN